VLLFQFSYDCICKSKSPSCCKLLPVLCWRHCLKTVQIEYYGEVIGKETLKRYFVDNAEILKCFQYRRGSGLPEDYQDRKRDFEEVFFGEC
jgi:hypothetical protein